MSPEVRGSDHTLLRLCYFLLLLCSCCWGSLARCGGCWGGCWRGRSSNHNRCRLRYGFTGFFHVALEISHGLIFVSGLVCLSLFRSGFVFLGFGSGGGRINRWWRRQLGHECGARQGNTDRKQKWIEFHLQPLSRHRRRVAPTRLAFVPPYRISLHRTKARDVLWPKSHPRNPRSYLEVRLACRWFPCRCDQERLP